LVDGGGLARIVGVGARAAARPQSRALAGEQQETGDLRRAARRDPTEMDDGTTRARRKRDPTRPTRGAAIPTARGRVTAAPNNST
jgi:hypothetical protein